MMRYFVLSKKGLSIFISFISGSLIKESNSLSPIALVTARVPLTRISPFTLSIVPPLLLIISCSDSSDARWSRVSGSIVLFFLTSTERESPKFAI